MINKVEQLLAWQDESCVCDILEETERQLSCKDHHSQAPS